METDKPKSNCLNKVLGSVALASVVAILALAWSIYSTRSDQSTSNKQLDNQATQIAIQETQIDLAAEENKIISEQATLEATRSSLEDQRLSEPPTDDGDYAPTATAIAIQQMQFEATSQALENQQKQIEANQTAIAQPQSTPKPVGLVNCSKFQKGEKRTVPGGTFVIGDIVINNKAQYDSSGTKEGTVAYFESEGEVYAEWGAGCYQGSIDYVDQIVQQQFESGCGSTCSKVRVVIVNENGKQDVDIRTR